MKSIFSVFILACIFAVGFYFIIYYLFETPTVENLTAENEELRNELKTNYSALDQRMAATLQIMSEIQERDSNLYRVLLQMDPLVNKDLNEEVIGSGNLPKISKLGDSQLVARLYKMMDTLERDMLHQSVSFDQIRGIALNMREKLDHTPAILPLHINDYTVSSGYGVRIDPVLDTPKFHEGLDMPADIGTNVYATADGTVSFTGVKSGYGNCIDIDHGNNYVTRYAHLSKISVSTGKKIKRGELIGEVGSTGKSTGPHLHYEVRLKDVAQNPVDFFFLDVTPEQYDGMVKRANNAGHVMD